MLGVGGADANHAPVVDPDLVPPGLLAAHNEASGLSVAPLARALDNHQADLFVQHFRVPAGAALGWHTHPGPAIVAIVRGYLGYQREVNGECVTTWYGPGTGFMDPGFGHVHRGIARPDVGFDSYATFVTPPGRPASRFRCLPLRPVHSNQEGGGMNTRRASVLTLVIALVAAVALASPAPTTRDAEAALPPGNTVAQWNSIAEDTVVGSGAFQSEGYIYMAYTSMAVYNAVVAIEGGYEPIDSTITAPEGASVDCAVVEAAYRTLSYYFSSFDGLMANLNARHAEALSELDGCTADCGAGTDVGEIAANEVI